MISSTHYPVPCIYSECNQIKTSPFHVSVPGSKSITNRALLLATLGSGTTKLTNVLFSDDSRHFLKCIQDLGFVTEVNEEAKTVIVTGQGGEIPQKQASLYVGSAGTAARFLTALLGVSCGSYHMDASEQMKKRPMAPLLSSLKELGCDIIYDEREGFFPFTISGKGFCKNSISVNIDSSSQFLSALLISSILSEEDLLIETTGSHGMSYIQMTISMLKQFGVKVMQTSAQTFVIPKGQQIFAKTYAIEPDVSAASYFYAMAPLLNLPILVQGVHSDSLQGDIAFLDILCKMGCSMEETDAGICLLPPADGILHGLSVDMSACSDQAITLAALSVFADSPTTITGIGHIRFQECDRLYAIASQLQKLGITCETGEDFITIHPADMTGCEIETFEDHRMAMGFSLIGLRVPNVTILNPLCCRKTFEEYFDTLDQMIHTLTGPISPV